MIQIFASVSVVRSDISFHCRSRIIENAVSHHIRPGFNKGTHAVSDNPNANPNFSEHYSELYPAISLYLVDVPVKPIIGTVQAKSNNSTQIIFGASLKMFRKSRTSILILCHCHTRSTDLGLQLDATCVHCKTLFTCLCFRVAYFLF